MKSIKTMLWVNKALETLASAPNGDGQAARLREYIWTLERKIERAKAKK